MGATDNSGQNSSKINFGNFSNTQDFSNLFGGGNVFNLGAGSSNTSVITSSTDLSSMFRDESTNTTRTETSGGGFGLDVGASVGVGVGGTGSAGSVDKTTANSFSEVDNSSITANRGGEGSSGIMAYLPWIAVGGGGLVFVFLLLKKKRK